MDNESRFAVGIDVGTENVRAVVLRVSRNKANGVSVIGYGKAQNGGMHKGVVSDLYGPAEAIDKMLYDVEKMSGTDIDSAYVSINGSHIGSVITTGMITIENSGNGGEITEDDIRRVEDQAITGQVPANRNILAILPINYTIDGQTGIRDPLGMTGTRLEIKANVVSALAPNCENLTKSMMAGKLETLRQIPTAMAAARAVLTERQMENGVAVIDFGAATTSVAVYDEGDLQFTGVVPVGSNNITNDLAILLQITTDVAEKIKLKYVSAEFPEGDDDIMIGHGSESAIFSRNQINQVVKDRLDDIFERVEKMLRAAGFAQKLPEGIVLVGGGAKMRGIEGFVKGKLKMATRIGIPGTDLAGVADKIEAPEFATAIGLALMMSEENLAEMEAPKKKSGGFFKGLFGKKK